MNAPTGIVNIRGKEYHTVAKRVADFREKHGDKYGLCTEIIDAGENVVIRALIIGREDNFVVATGTAEERRGAGQINKTSALENAETSAIGRALAAFGIGGTEFASANEVENAIHQQAAEGQSQGDSQGAVSPSTAMPDAEFAKLQQLVQATSTNIPAMLGHLSIRLPDNNLRLLDQDQYKRVTDALNDKLAKMAKAETDKKAKENA